MPASGQAIRCLRQLAGQDNFAGIPGGLYTGVADPAMRAELNARFASAVDALITATNHHASRDTYLGIIDVQIHRFDRTSLDSEDVEQVASNFEHAMDCLTIPSSDGILNRWVYGFDLRQFPAPTNPVPNRRTPTPIR